MVGAAMDRCKPCRWSGGSLEPEVLEDLYVQWARHRTIAALADGHAITGTASLGGITGHGGQMHWPVTSPAIRVGAVTVTPGCPPDISVDAAEAMAYVSSLGWCERAQVVDDLLDGLVGSELYPAEYRARLGLAR